MYKIKELTPSILLLLLIPLSVNACPSFITSNCNFQFSGISCPFIMCTSPNGTLRSRIWDTCIAICCQIYNGPSNPPIIETLDSFCTSLPESNDKLPLGATIAIALGLVIFIILAVGICHYLKLVVCHCPCLRAEREENYQQDARQAPSQLQIVEVVGCREEVYVTEELWEEVDSVRVCAICLSVQTNISTKCGHFYHSQCLLEWLKRNQSCPECRTKDMKGFMLFCSKCNKNYQKINVLREKEDYKCRYCKL